MKIKAFHALRPAAALADRLATPPYDVVDTAEARRLAEGLPHSFLRVTRPELELADGTDPASPAAYARAAENFRLFLKKGWLARDPQPGLFLYRQIRGAHAQCGLVAVCSVDDYEQEVILKHEKTRQKPEDDRTAHITATNAQTGPVFLAFRDRPALTRAFAEGQAAAPLNDFTAVDGVRHTVWRVADPAAWVREFAAVETAYIADGHHRAAAARRVARERAAANPRHTGAEEYNWFLAVLFPSSTLQILPYNRCVRDLNGLAPEAFLARVREIFDVAETAAGEPGGAGCVAMRLGEKWYRLSWRPDPAADPVAALDVSVLQDRLLAPVLGIADPRSNERISFVGGIHGTEEHERRVRDGRAAVAFSLHPVSLDQLMAVSDAGRIMPPKSTWFEPKLRDGLVVHAID